MNLIALFLVVTSLATAGVWSPATPKNKQNDHKTDPDQVIVKEGHRVVVVEFDKEKQPSTKVSISTEDQAASHHFVEPTRSATTWRENAKEKIKEASSFLPNLGQGSNGDHHLRTPKELICDAYGKCKHKIANAFEKTKEMAREDIEKKERAAHKVEEAVEKSIEALKSKASEAMVKKKETEHKVIGAAEEAYDKIKERVRHTAHEVEEQAKESTQKTMEVAKDAKDLGKLISVHVAKNISKFFAGVGRQVVKEAVLLSSIVSPKSLNPIWGMAYLIGYAIAYGTSVWVTFISSHVLAGALPRQQFGVVQSKVYPVYFRTMTWSIGTAFLGFVVSHRGQAFTGEFEKFQLYNLLSSLLLTFINMLYLEPKATKVNIIIIIIKYRIRNYMTI